MQVQRASMAEQAAEVLLQRIRSGEWPLGAKLPGETTLAPQLGVGRSTTREAIRQLAGRGVLTSRQGAGVFIAALEVPEDWQSTLSRADIVDIIEVRVAIETEAARLAARRRLPAHLRRIRRSLTAREQGSSTIEAFVDADMNFHRSVIEAAQNPLLTELYDGLTPRIRQAMIEMLRRSHSYANAEDQARHDRLTEAIAACDVVTAADSARTHLETLQEGFA